MLNAPLVIEYLKTHTVEQLEEEHGVNARPSRDHEKLILNYDQLLIKNGDVLAEQCRGLVVRPQNQSYIVGAREAEIARIAAGEPLANARWRKIIVGPVDVVAWPMCRFYNHGDFAAAKVNWDDPDLRVYEKLDGTCCILYWDEKQEQWCVATRSVPEADLPINCDDLTIGKMTFSELFWRSFEETSRGNGNIGWDRDWAKQYLGRNNTYVFELTSPHNRVVVQYDSSFVTLIAVRSLVNFKEIPVEHAIITEIPLPRSLPRRDPNAVHAFVEQSNPIELEGAVVCDTNFNRLKIKSTAWGLASRLKSSVTVSCSCRTVAVGLKATRKKIVSPLVMPP